MMKNVFKSLLFAALLVLQACSMPEPCTASNVATPSFSPATLSAPGNITISVAATGCTTSNGFPGAVISSVSGNGTTATVTLRDAQSYEFNTVNITGTTHFNGTQSSLTWTSTSTFTFSSTTNATDTAGAAVYPYVYYTIDGSTPYPNFNLYTGPVSIGSSGTQLQAIAVCPGLGMSSIESVTYTYTIPAATVSPSSGNVSHGSSITMKCDGTGSCNNANAVIYYTYTCTNPGTTPPNPAGSSNWGKQDVTFTVPPTGGACNGTYPFTLEINVLTTAPGYASPAYTTYTYTVPN